MWGQKTMSEEDLERFEDYLELARYLEELQAGHTAHPPGELTPAQARIYRMAELLRTASGEEALPRPEFVAALLARLEQERQQQPPEARALPLLPERSPAGAQQREAPPASSLHVSRRALFTYGATAAASLVAGAAIEHAVEERGTGSANEPYPPLVPAGIPTTWHFVAPLAALGESAVPFTTDTIVGYVIRDDAAGSDSDEGKTIALSAACTHMGCIVQWQDAERTFHCPCHGGLFSATGSVDSRSPVLYVRPLPRLETKVEHGGVYVRVPR